MTKGNQGYQSRNVRHTSAPKVEPRSHRVREPAVAQIGGNYGDHVTRGGSTGWRPGSIYGGKGYSNPVGPTNMALSGPGAGREVAQADKECMAVPIPAIPVRSLVDTSFQVLDPTIKNRRATMAEVKLTSNKGTMEQRINDRLKPSNATAPTMS